MERILTLVILLFMGIFFTGLGIFAWRREKPMWFWAGSEVKAYALSDVRGYNRANGIMWLCYSLVFYAGAVVSYFYVDAAAIVVCSGCIGGIPILIFAYKKIYDKYKKVESPKEEGDSEKS